MKTDDELEALVGAWIQDVGSTARAGYLHEVLDVTRTTPQHSAVWLRVRGLTPSLSARRWRGGIAVAFALTALLAAALGLALLAGSRREAPLPLHRNGAIVVESGGILYQAKPDGSDPTPLTSSGRFSTGAAVSPDGSLLAYTDYPTYAAYTQGSGATLVIRSTADGSTIARLAFASPMIVPGTFTQWAPDGSTLLLVAADAYHGYGDFYSIYLLNRDGTGLRRLDLGALEAWGPEWSPDGAAIAFTGVVGRPPSGVVARANLYTTNLDGTATRTVATGVYPVGTAWLAGGRLAYAVGDGNAAAYATLAPVWTVNLDGTGARRATSDAPWLDDMMAVSPDGMLLAITQKDPAADARVVIVRVDGVGGERLLQAPGIDADPGVVWSPDQTKLLGFARSAQQAAGRQALLIDVNGGSAVTLPVIAGRADAPSDYLPGEAWQPLAP